VQCIFIRRGADALMAMSTATITPALIGELKATTLPARPGATKPATLLAVTAPKEGPPWSRLAGYFQAVAGSNDSPLVITLAVLAILLLFPRAQAETSAACPANYREYFEGGDVCSDLTTRFEAYLTGSTHTQAKLPAEIVIAEIQLFRRLTPPHMP